MNRLLIALALAPTAGVAGAQQMVHVSESAWRSLIEPERSIISERYMVTVIPVDTVGVITDAQTLNESTPGTTGGAQVGAAYGSALYVDRAFRGPRYSYSATQNVSSALLGAIVGGMLDQRPQAQFHTRYTVRTLDGQVRYQDEWKADAFRHSVGVCVSLAGMRPIDQNICTQTAGDLRSRYVDVAPAPSYDAELFRSGVQVQRLSLAAGCSGNPRPVGASDQVSEFRFNVECADGRTLDYSCAAGICTAP